MEKSFIIHLLHSIPHINVNITGLHVVNSTFNPNSDVYIEVRADESTSIDKRDWPGLNVL